MSPICWRQGKQLADSSYTTNNWAGGTIRGTWTDVVGIWRVPTVSIPETPAGTDGGWDSSSWVGIDGFYGSNDVLQAGVQQSVAGDGSTIYVAWYEWFAPKVDGSPGYIYQSNIANMEIQPGDEVFAGIYYRNGKGFVRRHPLPERQGLRDVRQQRTRPLLQHRHRPAARRVDDGQQRRVDHGGAQHR